MRPSGVIAENTEKRARLQKIARGVVISLGVIVVLGVLTIALLTRGRGDEQSRQAGNVGQARQVVPQIRAGICPRVSSKETRGCTIETVWSAWIQPEEGPEVNGMRLCFSPGGQFEKKEERGTTFFRFKAGEGTLLKEYRLFPGDKPCPPRFPPA